MPTPQKFNLDGAFFGSSIPHIFFKFYQKMIVFPPSISLYEPKIYGFALAGKRGSKFYKPCKVDVLETAENER